MSTTARQIITRAMQKVGILVKSEPPEADEANDALNTLNALMSSLSNDSLMVYARVWESFALTGNVASYTIGSGQTFNTARPIGIDAAYVRQVSTDYPLTMISDENYFNQLYVKNIQGIPEFLNYDNAYPAATIRLWPVPLTNYTLFLLSEKELSTFATLDTNVILPPGWERFLINTLSIELAPEYGMTVPDAVVAIARESRGQLMRAVSKVHSLDSVIETTGRRRNIYGDRLF